MKPITLTRQPLAACGLAAAALLASTSSGGPGDACDDVAFQGYLATLSLLQSDFYAAYANCLNAPDARSEAECLAEALAELQEGLDLADEQFDARVELCAATGGGIYAPTIDPQAFSSTVTHPYYPLVPGSVRIYEVQTDEGLEVVTVTVTDDTRTIMGVECLAVSDIVQLEGELIEETLDYFAQDDEGNVWYFGEISQNFEDGFLVDLDGSWFAGVDDAQPGIIMPAVPTPGVTYRQEFLLLEAEDAATMLSTNSRAQVPAGNFTGCVKTADFTPIEPSGLEHKFFAEGIGTVLEVKPETGERLELVSYLLP